MDLPNNRLWAGGLLEPTTGFASVRDLLRDVGHLGGPAAVAELSQLPAEHPPRTTNLSSAAADALTRAAVLTFELRDDFGRAVAADVVRVIDLNDGTGVRVRAYFREATTGAPAWLPPEAWRPGTDEDAGV